MTSDVNSFVNGIEFIVDTVYWLDEVQIISNVNNIHTEQIIKLDALKLNKQNLSF